MSLLSFRLTHSAPHQTIPLGAPHRPFQSSLSRTRHNSQPEPSPRPQASAQRRYCPLPAPTRKCSAPAFHLLPTSSQLLVPSTPPPTALDSVAPFPLPLPEFRRLDKHRSLRWCFQSADWCKKHARVFFTHTRQTPRRSCLLLGLFVVPFHSPGNRSSERINDLPEPGGVGAGPRAPNSQTLTL